MHYSCLPSSGVHGLSSATAIKLKSPAVRYRYNFPSRNLNGDIVDIPTGISYSNENLVFQWESRIPMGILHYVWNRVFLPCVLTIQ